jgi:hypothetical protein
MKQIFTLLFILGSIHAAFAQKNKSKPAPVITRFYKLTGTIDKYPVTFIIHRKGEDYFGSYYYDATEEPNELVGTLHDGTLRMIANDRETGDMSEEFAGKFKDSSYSGTWTHNGKVLPFRVAIPRNTDGLSFDFVTTSGSKSLKMGQGFGRDAISYDAAAVCPTASSTHPAAQLIRDKVFEAFGYDSKNSTTIGQAMLADKKDVLSQGSEIEKYGVSVDVGIVYWSKQLLTLSIYNWEDNGGAHGNYTIKYINIDLANNTEAGGVFNECDQLAAVQDKKLREYFKVSNDSKISDFLLVDSLPSANNCIITTKGITYSYDPYEIAAYAAGQIKLYIPYKEVEGCLTEEFKKLVGMTGK